MESAAVEIKAQPPINGNIEYVSVVSVFET